MPKDNLDGKLEHDKTKHGSLSKLQGYTAGHFDVFQGSLGVCGTMTNSILKLHETATRSCITNRGSKMQFTIFASSMFEDCVAVRVLSIARWLPDVTSVAVRREHGSKIPRLPSLDHVFDVELGRSSGSGALQLTERAAVAGIVVVEPPKFTSTVQRA